VLSLAHDAGIERVVAVTHPDNEASQAVARRLGMSRGGLTRDYYDAECALFVSSAPVSSVR
jgi:RimJ/RimL family protein N-acetyltransferase